MIKSWQLLMVISLTLQGGFGGTWLAAEERVGVTVDRFQGAANDTSCRRLFMRLNDNGELVPIHASQTIPNSAIPRRFKAVDDFALGVMVERGVLSADEARFYSGTSARLRPEQVTQIETNLYSDTVPKAEKGKVAGFIKQFDLETGSVTTMRGRRRSVLRMISGQTLENGEIKRLDLPWTAQFPDFARVHLPRDRYPWVWEIGRTAQVEPEAIRKNLAVAVVVAYRELRALGGEISRALISAHAPTERNAMLYGIAPYRLKPFPNKEAMPLPGHPDRIMVLPLAEAIERPWVREKFEPLQKITGRAGLSTIAAFDLLEEVLATKAYAIQITSPRLASPQSLKIWDFTRNADATTAKLVQKAGVPEETVEELSHYLNEHLRSRVMKTDFTAESLTLIPPADLRFEDTGQEVPYVLIGGLENTLESSGGSAEFRVGMAFIQVLRSYRDLLLKQAVEGASGKIDAALFGTFTQKPLELVRVLEALGFSVTQAEMKTQPRQTAVLIEGRQLQMLETANASLLQTPGYEKRDLSRERIFLNPLNF